MDTILKFFLFGLIFSTVCVLLYRAWYFFAKLEREHTNMPDNEQKEQMSRTSFALIAGDMHTSHEDLSQETTSEEEKAPDTIRDSEPMLVTSHDLEPPLLAFEDPDARPVLDVYDYPAGEILIAHTHGGFLLLDGEVSRSLPDGRNRIVIAKVEYDFTMFSAAFIQLEPGYVYRVNKMARMSRINYAQLAELLFAFTRIGSYKVKSSISGSTIQGHKSLCSAFKTNAHHSKIMHLTLSEEYQTTPAPPSEEALAISAGMILPKASRVCIFPETSRPKMEWLDKDTDWSSVGSEIDEALRRLHNPDQLPTSIDDHSTTGDGPITLRDGHHSYALN